MYPPDQLIELFNERAAIMQHCGGMAKEDAEWAAYLEVKKLVGRTKDGKAVALPAEIVRVVKESKEQTFLF